ncbi:hypothetical protein [Kitasatospora sp. NPDC058478]|uniref:hypothetical protein n=1 Tax=unclassified Kitasatospora TaxID=2633591 RepID=UPI003664ADDF
MGSERMRGRRAVVARAPHVAVAVLAGLGLTVGLTASPAAAATTEGNWINEGGPARSPSAMTALWHDGGTYEAARGEDDRIWWRHGNGAWQLMPGNARTHLPPTLAVGDVDARTQRLVMFRVGDDGAAYYSFLQDRNTNRWTGWSRVPGSLYLTGEVSATYSTNGIQLATAAGNRPYTQQMYLRPGRPLFRPDWAVQDIDTRELRLSDSFTFTAGEQEFYASRGLTNTVSIARTRPGDGRNARYTELPGGGRCESLAIGRGGDPGHLATSPFDPGYAAQQNMAIGCISPNDHQLYLNRSTDGGNTWSGWAHSTGGPSPSDAAPEIHGFPGGEVFAVLSWGNDTAPFKRHMIVMKRVM